MMATFKDGRFSCEVHGDLGEDVASEPTDRPNAPEPDDEELARREEFLRKAGYPELPPDGWSDKLSMRGY